MRLALGAEKADSLGFSSTRVVPDRLLADGFGFTDGDLSASLTRMVR